MADIDAELVYPVEGKDAADVVGKYDAVSGFEAVTPEMLRTEIANAGSDEPSAEDERLARVAEAAESMRVQREARALLASEVAKTTFTGFGSMSSGRRCPSRARSSQRSWRVYRCRGTRRR